MRIKFNKCVPIE